MADEVSSKYLSSTEQIAANYKKYADMYENDDKGTINVDTFLNLLVAEMTNQDPLEPTSNTEFISQMAQFSSLQSMENASYYSNATYASSLVGKTVTVASYSGTDYNVETGVVQSIELSNKTFNIKVNDKSFKLSAVQSVKSAEEAAAEASTSADKTYAATLVGMFVTVQAKDAEGQTVVDEGVVQSFEVKDNVVRIIIDGVGYNLKDIVKVRYAVDSDFGTDTSTETTTDPTETTPAEDNETGTTTETTQLSADNTDSATRDDIADIEDDFADVEDLKEDAQDELASLINDIQDESDVNELFEKLLEMVQNGEL